MKDDDFAKRFTVDAEASAEDVKVLGDRLDAFNARQTSIDDCRPIRLAVRDAHGTLVGGLGGVTNFGWLYIAVVWVDEAARGRGLGSRLMDMVEAEAIRRGCKYACLTTFSFQARPFHERRGYEVFGQLDDYPAGETMYFLRKRLDDAGPDPQAAAR
jgi:GNAT superfamily N-acetyltransferase